MANQPDFGVWSKWFQATNMSSAEFRAVVDKGSLSGEAYLSDDEATMLINMITTGDTFQEACSSWGAYCWEFCREQVSRNVFPGYDSSKEFRQEPSRDQLSMGNIESSSVRIEHSDNGSVSRCVNCDYWGVQEKSDSDSDSCPECGNSMVGE